MRQAVVKLPPVLWIGVAIILSIFIALTPLLTALTVLGIGVLGLLVWFSPLGALGIMLILAPLRTLIATEAAYPLPLDIGQLTFLATAGIWAIWRILQRKPIFHIPISPVHVAIGIFSVAFGLSLFNASSNSAWITEFLKWVIMALLVSIVLTSGEKRRWEWLLFLLISAGVANAIVGIYIFLGGSGADHLLILGRFYRAFGTFGQPNPFGGFMGILTPIAITATIGYGLRSYRRWKIKGDVELGHILITTFYGMASLILLGGLLVSWSRGAWLGTVAAIGVMAFAIPRKFWHSFMMTGAIGLAIGILWFSGALPQSITNRISSAWSDFFAFDDMRGVDITSENYAVVERLAHWQAALNMAQYHPWLGVGAGNYEVVYDQYRLLNWDEPLGHAHNYYLNILAEAGIIGLLCYMGMWGIIAWLTWQTRAHPDVLARFVAVGLLGTWTYLAFHSLLDNLYVNNVFLHLGVLLGLLAVLYQQTSKASERA